MSGLNRSLWKEVLIVSFFGRTIVTRGRRRMYVTSSRHMNWRGLCFQWKQVWKTTSKGRGTSERDRRQPFRTVWTLQTRRHTEGRKKSKRAEILEKILVEKSMFILRDCQSFYDGLLTGGGVSTNPNRMYKIWGLWEGWSICGDCPPAHRKAGCRIDSVSEPSLFQASDTKVYDSNPRFMKAVFKLLTKYITKRRRRKRVCWWWLLPAAFKRQPSVAKDRV